MIVHGDRREPAQSGGVVDEVEVIVVRDDHVLRELILFDHVGNETRRRDREPPPDDVGESPLASCDRADGVPLAARERGVHDEGNLRRRKRHDVKG